MEEVLEQDSCRAIGVSNYTVGHLEEVLEHGQIVPAVDQIELHPYLHPRNLAAFCRTNGIQIESYSPLNQGMRLVDPVIARVAKGHRRTPAQVVLRWHLQHDFIPIPRSVSREHVEENLAVFDFALSDEEMNELDSLDRGVRLA